MYGTGKGGRGPSERAGYSNPEDRRTCIICGENVGTIQTVDGLVCPSCMPLELMPQAGRLRKHSIVIYHRTNTGWESCGGTVGTPDKRDIEDRSAAITTATPTILADELIEQIRTAESVDIVVSFIMLSGLSLLMGALTEFTRHGRLRVVTTSYMGATEYPALVELFSLPNTEVRMELNAERSRLHAKSFIFNRPDNLSVAFVGSANISKSALTDGEEWVVKLREQDVPEVIGDLRRSYEALWNSNNVKTVTAMNRAEIEASLERRGK